MADALNRLDQALVDGSAGVAITTRHGEPWITVPRLEALAEPANLDRIKDEVIRRWGTLDLLDVLKDSDYLAEFTTEFTSVASREVIDRATLRRQLLLCLFALGTNIGYPRHRRHRRARRIGGRPSARTPPPHHP